MSDELASMIESAVDTQNENPRDAIVLANQDADELALLLESLPLEPRLETWQQINQSQQLEVLVAMRSDPRESILDEMTQSQLDELFVEIAAEDLIELAESLPKRMIDRALNVMDDKQKAFFKEANAYPEHQAGHWVNHEILVLPLNARVRDGMRLLRRELPSYTDTVFLVNRTGQFSVAVKISEVVRASDHLPLVDLALEEFPVIDATEDEGEAAKKVQFSGFTALPVVGENGKLLGRLDIGDACEIINEIGERQLMASAGMDEDEDLFSPVKKSAKNRAVWLGLNLLTAFLASWFIGLFEATISEVVALAVLMPIVASMGGIAGSQSLTLMIRGLALGQVTQANRMALLKKELSVGGLNGVIWALVVGLIATLWFQSPLIGVVIGVAIVVNIISAAFSGVVIPVVLDKLKLDPALSGSVILTTVTDIVGFVVFLGLGTWLLL